MRTSEPAGPSQRADAIARLEEFLDLWGGGEDPMVSQAREPMANLRAR